MDSSTKLIQGWMDVSEKFMNGIWLVLRKNMGGS